MFKKNLTLFSLLILLSTISTFQLSAQNVEIETTTGGFLPPRLETMQRDAISVSSSTDGMIIYNTDTKKLNIYDGGAGAWQELGQPSVSPIDYFRALPNGIQLLLDAGETPANIVAEGASPNDFIGLNYLGGIIFFVDTDGSGLISSTADQSTGAEWGCNMTNVSGATGLAIGEGMQNTTAIATASCSTSGIAARICSDLELNGYSDWFLPSRDELVAMYEKIEPGASEPNTNIGNLSDFYWSSTQHNDSFSWMCRMQTGALLLLGKIGSNKVRAIRAF